MKKIIASTTLIIILLIAFVMFNRNDSSDFTITSTEWQELQQFIPTVTGIVHTKEEVAFSRSTNDFTTERNITNKVSAMHPFVKFENGAYQIVTSENAVAQYTWISANDVYEITANPDAKKEEVMQFTEKLLSTLQNSYETLNSSDLAPFYNTSSAMYEYEIGTIEKMRQDERKIRIVDFRVLDVLRHGNTYWPIVIVKYHRYWPNEIRRSTYYEYSIYNVLFHENGPRIESLQLYFR